MCWISGPPGEVDNYKHSIRAVLLPEVGKLHSFSLTFNAVVVKADSSTVRDDGTDEVVELTIVSESVGETRVQRPWVLDIL